MRLRSSKLVTLTALLLMSLCLTSCKDQQYLREVDYSSTFATAKKRNQEVIINLWHAGVISEASKTEYVDKIEKNVAKYEDFCEKIVKGEMPSSTEQDLANQLGASIVNYFDDRNERSTNLVDYQPPGGKGSCDAGHKSCPEPKTNKLTLAGLEHESWIEEDKTVTQWRKIGNNVIDIDNITALRFLEEADYTALKNEMESYVFVLNPAAVKEDRDMQNLLAQIKAIADGDSTKTAGLVQKYFKNTNKKLFDFSEFDLFVDSTNVNDIAKYVGKQIDTAVDNSIINQDIILTAPIALTYVHHHSRQGKKDKDPVCDCKTASDSKTAGVYSLRIREFNKEFFDIAMNRMLTDHKFLKISYGNGQIYLLMEYPVERLTSIEMKGSGWDSSWEFANMYLNIYSGEMVYYEEVTDETTGTNKIVGRVINNEEDPTERLYKAYKNNMEYNTDVDNHLSFVVGESVNIHEEDALNANLEDITSFTIGDPVTGVDEVVNGSGVEPLRYYLYKLTGYDLGPDSLYGVCEANGYELSGDTIINKSDKTGYKLVESASDIDGVTAKSNAHIMTYRRNEREPSLIKGSDGKESVIRQHGFYHFGRVCDSKSLAELKENLVALYTYVGEDASDIEQSTIYTHAASLSFNEELSHYFSDYLLLKWLLEDLGFATLENDYDGSLWNIWLEAMSEDTPTLLSHKGKEYDAETQTTTDVSIYLIEFKLAKQDEGIAVLTSNEDKEAEKYSIRWNLEYKFILPRATSLSGTKVTVSATNKSKLRKEGDDFIYTENGVDYYCKNLKQKSAEESNAFLDESGRIVADTRTVSFKLTDYLELLYLPGGASSDAGILLSEPFIATGRRVTFTKFKSESGETADLAEVIGYYGNKYGDKLLYNEQELMFQLGDIIDVTSGKNDYSKVALRLKAQKGKNVLPTEVENATSNYAEAFKAAGVVGELETEDANNIDAKMLQYSMYKDKLDCILRFTSKENNDLPALDAVDYDKIKYINGNADGSIKPSLYYGVCLFANPYQTGLYNQWIDIDTSEAGINGCVTWWNEWLASRGYAYRIDLEALKNLINGIYSISYAKGSNVITFNEKTISTINDDILSRREKHTNNYIRTVEILIGCLLLFYGILLMAAWFIDINLTNGPEFLKILTFGKLCAISNSDDVPRVSDERFADLKYIGTLNIILIATGLILIIFDLNVIIGTIYSLISNFVDIIHKIFANRRS